jgi:enoyl-CoA hydratase/carnithine racemase
MTSAADDPVVMASRPVPSVLLLTLNRPGSRNSLVLESWIALETALGGATPDHTRCVVLTGAGGYFSSGGDLKSTPHAGVGATAVVGRLEHAHRVIAAIRGLPVPVIAAVEGGAAGLGWSLTLACDLVVAADGASFAAPFVERGVVPDGGAAWFLSHRLGRVRTASLLLGGERLAARDAHTLGLVTEIAPAGTCVARAISIARSFEGSNAQALELTKRLMRSAEELALDEYLALELAFAALTQSTGEAANAREAFRSGASPGRALPVPSGVPTERSAS